MIPKLEGHCDLPNATIEDIGRAVREIARPAPPFSTAVNRLGGEPGAET